MDQNAKRLLLQKIPYGLYVVTTQDGDNRSGFTVTWLSQVSFRPPLVAMAVAKGSQNHTAVRRAGFAAIHFLSKSSAEIADRFILPTRRKPDKFEGLAVGKGATGAPVLEDAIGVLEGRLVHQLETMGDHDLYVFEITNAILRRDEAILELRDTKMSYGG
jgi:flavin reductase (DIM6/NTAB) family NADH-FMN oxidoreductase RutF